MSKRFLAYLYIIPAFIVGALERFNAFIPELHGITESIYMPLKKWLDKRIKEDATEVEETIRVHCKMVQAQKRDALDKGDVEAYDSFCAEEKRIKDTLRHYGIKNIDYKGDLVR